MAPTRTRSAFAGRVKQPNMARRRERMTDEKSDIPDSAVGLFLEIPGIDDWKQQLHIAKDQTAEAWRQEDVWFDGNNATDDKAVLYTDKPGLIPDSCADAEREQEIDFAGEQASGALEAQRIRSQSEAFQQVASLKAGESLRSTAQDPIASEDLSELSDSSGYQTYFESKQSTSMAQPGGFSFGQKGTSGEQTQSVFGTAGASNAQNKPTFSFNTNTNTNSSPSNFFGSSNNAASPSTATGGPPASSFGSLFGKPSTAQTSGPSSTPPATSSGLSFSFTPAPATTPAPTSTNATSTASSGSGFGNTLGASTGNPGGFGSTGAAKFSFGNAQASSATAQSASATTAAPTTTTPLFGGTTPSLFGTQPSASSNTPSGASTPQGQRQAPAFSTTPAGNPPQNLFGSNNTQSSTQAGTSATTSTTPAVTQSSLFPSFNKNGNNASASSPGTLFGRPAAAAPTNPRSNLFNPQPTSSASSTATSAGTTATPAAPSGNLFGGLTSSSKPAATSQPAVTTSAPATSNLFGTPSTSQPAPAQATSSLFGNGTPAATTASSGSNLFGSTTPAGSSASSGGNLFGAAAPAQSAATSSPAAGNLFSNLGASSSSTPAATTATSAAAPNTNLFGATSTSQPTTTTATSSAAPASLFPANATAPPTNLFGGPASTSGPTPPAQSRLAQKTMDEILTGWSTSLTSHQKTFQSLAKQVSTWDRALVENSTRISQLYGRCFQAERDCSEVERQLSHVEHSQSELEAYLERYEGEVDRLMDQAGFGDGGSGVGGVDAERERTYKMAENCSARLNEMGQSLTSMIDEINDASAKLHSASSNGPAGGRSDDPLQQIVRVLNQHLAQLQTIDNGANALKTRVAAAHRDARDLSQSQDLNGGNRALDDFGRSYLGRT